MAFTTTDLRLIICEDEYLLAIDMAEQFAALGARVVDTVSSAAELERLLDQDKSANAVLLDVELSDGVVYDIVPRLEERGLALAFCSAHLVQERPARFAHLEWFDKLASAGEIASALCAAHDGRSDRHSH